MSLPGARWDVLSFAIVVYTLLGSPGEISLARGGQLARTSRNVKAQWRVPVRDDKGKLWVFADAEFQESSVDTPLPSQVKALPIIPAGKSGGVVS